MMLISTLSLDSPLGGGLGMKMADYFGIPVGDLLFAVIIRMHGEQGWNVWKVR